MKTLFVFSIAALMLVHPCLAQDEGYEAAKLEGLQAEFKMRRITSCSLLRTKQDELWLVINVARTRALITSMQRGGWWLDYDDLDSLRQIKEIVRYGSGTELWGCNLN